MSEALMRMMVMAVMMTIYEGGAALAKNGPH